MSALIYFSDQRRLVPLLENIHEYKHTRNLGGEVFRKLPLELKANLSPLHHDLKVKIARWQKEPDDALAKDILSQALVDEVLDGYQEIKLSLLNKNPNNVLLNWLYNKSRHVNNLEDTINYNFKKLEIEPKDCLTWTDQSINFMRIGDRIESLNCIEKALEVDSDLGYVVRTASRIFNLTGDRSRSIQVLKRSRYYSTDPQILSAELAFSLLDNRRTKGFDIGYKLVKKDSYTFRELTELASTLASEEYNNGSKKKAKSLFEQSLQDPNKNSVAQALWYEVSLEEFENITPTLISNESMAHQATFNSDFETALIHARSWQRDEPFSHRPYNVASNISGVLLDKYDDAYRLVQDNMNMQVEIKGSNLTEEEDRGYTNDSAYFLLKADRIQEAEVFVQKLMEFMTKSKQETIEQFVNLATLGLYCFRVGKIEEGRRNYRMAMRYFSEHNRDYLHSSALVNLIDEELRLESSKELLTLLMRELEDSITPNSNPDLQFRKSKLMLRLETRLKKDV